MVLATTVPNLLPEWQVDARSLGVEPRTSRYDTLTMGSAKKHPAEDGKGLRTALDRITGDRQMGPPADQDTGMVYGRTGTPADRDGTPGWYTGWYRDTGRQREIY